MTLLADSGALTAERPAPEERPQVGAVSLPDKGFRGTTHRACPPAETLALITPLLPLAGVTRLADITGLDRIGIPVTLAIRPNSRTVVGSTGKGSTLLAAKVSGAMEAIEMHHAEYAAPTTFSATIADLVGQCAEVVDVERLPLVKNQSIRRDLHLEWCTGVEWRSGSARSVPFSCVHLRPPTEPGRLSGSPFQRSSNGLASGNIPDEAVLAGLYEVIERDAYSLARSVPGFWNQIATMVNLSALRFPEVDALLDRCREAGTGIIVQDITSDIGVPAFAARIFDIREPEHGFGVGYGCHLETEVAIVRSITEAAQGRAVVQVAGSRDDITQYERWTMRLFGHEVQALIGMAEQAQHIPVLGAAQSSFTADFDTVAELLTRRDLPEVVVVDLTTPEFGVPVVRVIVPGLEGISTFPSYQPGRRALEHRAAGR